MDASAPPGKGLMRRPVKWLVVAALLGPVAAVADDRSGTLARQAVDLSVAEGMDAASTG